MTQWKTIPFDIKLLYTKDLTIIDYGCECEFVFLHIHQKRIEIVLYNPAVGLLIRSEDNFHMLKMIIPIDAYKLLTHLEIREE